MRYKKLEVGEKVLCKKDIIFILFAVLSLATPYLSQNKKLHVVFIVLITTSHHLTTVSKGWQYQYDSRI